MPVKRRGEKSRFVAPWGGRFTELELWSCVFDTGSDLLGLLELVGKVETVDHSPPIGLARDAWERLGVAHLTDESRPRGKWAIAQFGMPGAEQCR